VIFRRVVNASPLIFLTRLGLLDLLNEPGVPVIVPDTVLLELGGLVPNDPAVLAVPQSPWLHVVLIEGPVGDELAVLDDQDRIGIGLGGADLQPLQRRWVDPDGRRLRGREGWSVVRCRIGGQYGK
jgi:hypothetical protein